MLDAPTHEIAAFSDMVKIGNLVDDCAEDVGEALRYAGYRRSKELLELHRAKIERLAEALAERMELGAYSLIQSENPSLMSASLRKRLNCCAAAKCSEGPGTDIMRGRR